MVAELWRVSELFRSSGSRGEFGRSVTSLSASAQRQQTAQSPTLRSLGPRPRTVSVTQLRLAFFRLYTFFCRISAHQSPTMASQQPPSAVDLQSSAPQDKPVSDPNARFGLKPDQRLPYIAMATFGTGMGIGAFHGSQTASYRFRAENAHRFPTTNKGWFLYHKDKSNLRLVTAVKEGLKMGTKLSAGALAFGFFEETVDKARNDRDFLSTVTAGLTFSGIFSLLGWCSGCPV